MAGEAELIAAVKADLVTSSGGFLRNPLRPAASTCDICSTPISGGWGTCYNCGRVFLDPRCADQVGAMVYAVDGQQGGYMMRQYKAQPRPIQEHVNRVAYLTWLGLSHRVCAGNLIGRPVDAWTVVPSLAQRPGSHPLRHLVQQHPFFGLPEVCIAPGTSITTPRAFVPTNFVVAQELQGEHILLLDDTWTSGGHVQSAAAALKDAGAASVSALCIARWLNPDYSDTAAFIRQYWPNSAYDPDLCPWTGFNCP